MADTETPRATTESAVGDECAVGTATSTLQRTGDGKHLAHARATLRALVANHQHGARRDITGHDRSHRTVFAVEHSCYALERLLVVREAGNLDNCTIRRERTREDIDAALGMNRRAHRANHVVVGRRRVDLGQILGHRLTGAGHDVAVEETFIQEMLHHHGHAADAVNVGHVIAPTWFRVGDVRHFRGDAIEIVERQRNAGFVGECEQVQDRIGAAAECVDDGDGVLERLLGHNVARHDAESQQIDNGFAGATGVGIAAGVDGWRRGGARQAHADGLGDARHGVGSEHAAAGSFTWAGGAFNLVDFFARHGAGRIRTDGFEHGGDVDVLALVYAGENRPVVHEHTRQIETRSSHQHRRNALVATSETYEAVESLCVHDGFNAVADDFTTHERRTHAFVAHADAIAHGDGAELERHAAGRANAEF